MASGCEGGRGAELRFHSSRASPPRLCRGSVNPSCENIPLYRNSEMTYVSAIPAHPRGAIMCRDDRGAGLAVDAAASGAKGQGQGGLLSVSPRGFAQTDGAVRFVAPACRWQGAQRRRTLRRRRAARTAKPCGPGRRCYGQALADAAVASTGVTAGEFRWGEGGQNELGSRESAA